MEISKTFKEIKDTLKLIGKDLCLATRISEILSKDDWKPFEKHRKVLNSIISLCRLYESLIHEQFPAKYKERVDNIYGNINN